MKCCLCGHEIEKKFNEKGKIYWDSENNAQPLKDGRCCDECNSIKVIPARMKNMGVN